MFEYTTKEAFALYADKRGYQSPNTQSAEGGDRYTENQVDAALCRTFDYITHNHYNKFKPEYKAATLAELPEQERLDLEEAANIIASHELEIPGTYAVQIPGTDSDQDLKKIGSLELFPKNTTNPVQANVFNDEGISVILCKYMDDEEDFIKGFSIDGYR